MTTLNVALSVGAIGLISSGVAVIGSNLLQGSIEIILGIALAALYEIIPPKTG